MSVSEALYISFVFGAIALLFFVLRRLVWWYFGIDKHLENQQAIIDLLGKQIAFQQIAEDQAARRRLESTQPAAQSHQPQNPTRHRSPPQP